MGKKKLSNNKGRIRQRETMKAERVMCWRLPGRASETQCHRGQGKPTAEGTKQNTHPYKNKNTSTHTHKSVIKKHNSGTQIRIQIFVVLSWLKQFGSMISVINFAVKHKCKFASKKKHILARKHHYIPSADGKEHLKRKYIKFQTDISSL